VEESEEAKVESAFPTQYTLPDGSVIPRKWQFVVSGDIPLEELDDVELSRMQLRDKRGSFSGAAPRLVPRDIAEAHGRELLARNDRILREVLLPATEVFVAVMLNERAKDADRMKAAEYLHTRFMGKVPDKLEVTAELKPWEGLVAEVVVITEEAEPGLRLIQGEVG